MSARYVPPRVPVADPRTGLMTREWYLFFQALMSPNDGALSDELLLAVPGGIPNDGGDGAGDADTGGYPLPVILPDPADHLPGSCPHPAREVDELMIPPPQAAADLSAELIVQALGYTPVNAAGPVLNAQAAGTFVLPANAFTVVPYANVSVDNASAYNTSSGIYTIPSAGIYMIVASLRVPDSTPTGISYGLGVGPAVADDGGFLWSTTGTGGRQGIRTVRMLSMAAGDTLRAYAYITGGSYTVISGELSIVKLR